MSRFKSSIIDLNSSDEDVNFQTKDNDFKTRSSRFNDTGDLSDDFFDLSPTRKEKHFAGSSNKFNRIVDSDTELNEDKLNCSPVLKFEDNTTISKVAHNIVQKHDISENETLLDFSEEDEKQPINKPQQNSSQNVVTKVNENSTGINFNISEKSTELLSKIKDFIDGFDNSKGNDQHLKHLESMYLYLIEVYTEFLDKIPLPVLNKLSGFDEKIFFNIKNIKERVKSKLRLTASTIGSLEKNENKINDFLNLEIENSMLKHNNKIDNCDKEINNVKQKTYNIFNLRSSQELKITSVEQNTNLVKNQTDNIDTTANRSNRKIFQFKSPVVNSPLPNINNFLSEKSSSKLLDTICEDLDKNSKFSGISDSFKPFNKNYSKEIFARDQNFSSASLSLPSSSNYLNEEPNQMCFNSLTSSLPDNKFYLSKETVVKQTSSFTKKEDLSKVSKIVYENSINNLDSYNKKVLDNKSSIPITPVLQDDLEYESMLDEDGWQIYDINDFTDKKKLNKTKELNNLNKFSASPLKQKSIQKVESKTTKNALGTFRRGIKNDAETGEFDGLKYCHSEEMMVIFRETFGLKTFRTNQLQVINATMLGYDCFVLMPTGGGKSLCYQLPALLTKGVTIVISPLKSLILDQVNKMESLDIPANHLSGDVTMHQCNEVYNDLSSTNPKLKLLYVTPEKVICSNRLQDILKSLYNRGLLAKFVIDEAHCVSQWGHDFRPDYKKLSILRNQFPKTNIIALTATATPRVRQDVINQLQLKNFRLFLCSFNRPNLKYVVLPKKSGPTMIKDIETLIKNKYKNASGIIYCLSRNDCDDMAQKLTATGIKAASYHAGMTDKLRESVQKSWLTNKIKVICATIAFGMGIDKPDVRFVVHSSLPKSIEGYYQESGRAGRDGGVALCVLYYNYSDMQRYRKMMDKDASQTFDSKQVHMNNLKRIVGYCENVTDCRRSQQLDYFAEIFDRDECKASVLTACDNCESLGQYKVVDVTEDCRAVARAVKDLCLGKSKFTLLHMCEIFKGSSIKKIMDFRHNNSALYGRGKNWTRADCLRLFHKMVMEEYLSEEIVFYNDIPNAYIKLGPRVDILMGGNIKIELPIKCKQKLDVKEKKTTSENITEQELQFKNISDRCYSDLLDVCRSIASERNVTMASVINLQALKVMSERLPETEADMMSIPHVTRANFEKYGKMLLEVTLKYTAEKLCLMMDLQDMSEEISAKAEESNSVDDSLNDTTNWSSLANKAASSKPNSLKKRKSSWTNTANKRFKGSSRGSKRGGRGGRGSRGQFVKKNQRSSSGQTASAFLSPPRYKMNF